MKYPKVLNRRMFNPTNSAYGRGIAANLVTEQQRQKFNWGGRVGLANGSDYEMDLEEIITPDSMTLSEKIKKGYLRGGRGIGDYPDTQTQHDDLAESIYSSRGANHPKWHGKGKKFKQEPFTDEPPGGADKQWPAPLSKIDQLLAKGKSTEVRNADGEIIDTDTIDIEEDWTPAERKEKMGQMQMAIAARLIGGSRDPWGSTAQMKNIGEGLKEIAGIGDKSKIRETERYFKAKSKYAQANEIKQLKEAHKLNTSQARKVFELEAAGAEPDVVLKNGYGIPTTKAPIITDKQNNRQLDTSRMQEGVVYYDKYSNDFRIIDPRTKKIMTLSKDEVVKVYPNLNT